MNPPTAAIYIASQIAARSGRSPQAVRQILSPIPTPFIKMVNGNATKAWEFSMLPAWLQSELTAIAERQGYADAHTLLSGAVTQWQPQCPAADHPAADLELAVKRRTLLAPFLTVNGSFTGNGSDTRSPAQFEADGVAAYQNIFGRSISPDGFRKLFTRTVERDNGLEDWNRLEIYLDDRPVAAPQRRIAAVQSLPEDLADTIKTLDDASAPTADDRKYLFDTAFRQIQDGADKASILRNLFRAVPGVSKTEAALRRSFNRKYAAWLQAEGDADALEDKRRLLSGNFRKPVFSLDEKKIRDEAILHGGNESLAYRKLRQAGKLSEAFVKYYHFDARRNKSYLPATVRNAITPEVEMCGPIHQGPWKAKMAGPYIPRDWSAVQPGEWYSGDDITWNSYFYFYDEEGKLHIERGECLLLHDLRTGYLLNYVLIAGKYNSRHIRRLILQAHDTHGLPHQGFYFERGVWKARIIRDLDSRENVHWRDTEHGLKSFNLQVRHATTPRAKTIEGLIRILQERQRNEPGFVGFNERTHEMERIQDFLARARRGTADPAEQLLSMEQWTKRLDEIFSAFNADVQNGKMLKGSSPAEMWQSSLQRRPLRQLPDEARYLLATHCTKVKVHQQGIVLTIGGEKKLFCGEPAGALIGREVLAYYNLDCPDLLTVSDLNRQNYFTMKAVSLPALSATKEQFAVVQTQIAGHRKAAKTIYGQIQRPSAHTITRDNDVRESAQELGRFHNAETEKFQEEQTATKRKLRKIQTAAAAAGLPVSRNIQNPDRVLRGIALEQEALARITAKEQAKQT